MHSEIPNIIFDDKGICNYCRLLEKMNLSYPTEKSHSKFDQIIADIKARGKRKKHDCVVGVSGGADSTYVLYLLKKHGLNPLAVHCDNGWNSELAVSNMKNMLNILNVDLFTYVIDWNEFKELQKAFFKASVPDIETLTDNANTKILYQIAAKKGIKYIIKGNNFRTEGIVPRGWTYFDKKYFNHLRKHFSSVKIKTYPLLTLFDHFYYPKIKRIKIVKILNYVEYIKTDIISILEKELKWRNYGGKHYESIFTRFFQSYYLPEKFNIDKRLVHLSALICSGQISRKDALQEYSKSPYPKKLIIEDINYIQKKWSISNTEFDMIMNSDVKFFTDYPSYFTFISFLKKIRVFFTPTFEQRP